jgi:hypothetical protein
MANLVSPFTIDALRSATGFSSPGFTVAPDGTLTLSGDITVGGNFVLGNSGTIQSGSAVLLTPSSLGSSITSSYLTSVGTLTGLSVAGATHLTGTVTINSTPVTGTIDNVDIGLTTPGVGSFSQLNITQSLNFDPAVTGSIDNTVIGGITPVAGTFTSVNTTSVSTTSASVANNLAVNGSLTVGGTNIKSLAIAMSVAMS